MVQINRFLVFLTFALIIAGCKPSLQDNRTEFNDGWKFFLGNDSLASSVEYDDSQWQAVPVPHDWSIEGEFSEDNPTKPGGGALPAGTGWYRKSFTLNPDDQDKKIYIDFDGVYRNSEVWINGEYLGKRANGYISFRYDLTPFVHFDGTENIIAVKADNMPQPNSRWYTGSGIYRNVWLVKLPQLHIKHWGTFITTPEITDQKAIVNINTELDGVFDHAGMIKLTTTVYSPEGKRCSRQSDEVVYDKSLPVFSQNLNVETPQYWSPEKPNLYTAKLQLCIDGKLIQEEEHTFGIRSFRYDADSGFYLNNKHYEIRGVNLHHDMGALGAAVNVRAIERQLQLMQGMGVNAIRVSHNPPATELLELCDKMGFLVMDEAFDVWRKKKVKYDYHIDFEENHEKDLRDLILRDRNHASVFMWSIGNEIREQFDSTGIEIGKELKRIVMQYDTTRAVTCALTETDPQKNFIYQSGALDVLGFNYKHEDWAKFKENYPGQKMIATENMSAYATRGHYDMPSDSTRYWPASYDAEIIGGNDDYTVSAYDAVCAYWGATHEETLKALYSYDFIGGMFIWCGIDFIGEPVPYEWPAKSSYYGVVDLAGFPKDVYYLYQSIWTDKPTLHIFPHWNWTEGQDIDIWAYYNHADEVELFLNGKSVGISKKEGNDMHVMWRVKYEPGTLKAISRKNGKVVLEREIKTAGKAAKIVLEADRSNIDADGKDLSFVTVKIEDADGNLVPDADNLVKFKINGNGFIAGVDNGYQASHEPFKASQRKAFNGLCLAIIQNNGTAGTIQLEATSDGLETADLTINVK